MSPRKKQVVKVEDKKIQDYELVFIVKPEFADEQLESTITNISQFITGKEGVVSNIERWGKRKLAYPVKHSLEGNYVLAKIQLNPQRCKELETSLRISEDILRHMLVKVE
jgi:small subunit ribosomal protein S6